MVIGRWLFGIIILGLLNVGDSIAQGPPTVGLAINGTIRAASGEGISGVTITFSNGGATAVTDGNGSYGAPVSSGYSGTATPSRSGYSFSPPNRTYNGVSGNQTGQDFTGTPSVSSYTLSGTVRTSAGQGIAGVTISLNNGGPSSVTDSGGNYSAAVSAGYSGAAAPGLAGYTFTPPSRAYSNVSGSQAAQDYTGTPPVLSYNLSGTVRSAGGQGISGATINFGNGGPSPVTDSGGNYSATVSAGYSGTATPGLTGYTFTPSSRTYSNVSGSQSAQDYTGTPPVLSYNLSGSVITSSRQGIPNVTVAFSNGGPIAVADGNGNYSASVSAGYSGTVTPSRSGYTFSPPSRSYTNVNSNQTGHDYTGAPPIATYSISGTVRTPVGQPIAGATISFSNGGPVAVTNSGGNYSGSVAVGYSGSITPSLPGYSFSPGSRSYSNVGGNQSGQDYTGTPNTATFSIGGMIRTAAGQGIGGVTINFSNGGPGGYTDSNGSYSVTVSAGYSGDGIPALAGYAFAPGSRTYANVTANRFEENYVGSAAGQYPIFTVGPIPANCHPPAAGLQFTVATSRIYAWFPVQRNQGDSLYFVWYDPSQNRWQRSSGNLSFTGTGCAWSWIDVAGTSATSLPGTWRFEYGLSGILQNSNTFQLVAGTSGVLPHLVDGGGWQTSIVLVNLDVAPAEYTLSVYGDDGNKLAPNWAGLGPVATLSGVIPVGGSRTFQTAGVANSTYQAWGQLQSPQNLRGLATFRWNGQEATVPLLGITQKRLFIPFDNTAGLGTGIALAAPIGPASVAARGEYELRNEQGQPLPARPVVVLAPNGHTSFNLPVLSTLPQDLRGVMILDAKTDPLYALGIRGRATESNKLTFTSIEAVSAETPGTRTIPHFVDGATWKTTFIIVNTDSVAATFTLLFWNTDGSPFQVPLRGTAPQSVVTGLIPPGGSRSIETAGIAATASTGWAEVLSSQSVGGTAVFQWQSNGQEAAVPFLSSGGPKLVFPFENGRDLALGVALANPSVTQDTTISATIRDEAGNIVPGGYSFILPKHQQTSFVLSIPNGTAETNRGTVEFNSAITDILGLGIRFNSGAFTSVRALVNPARNQR